MKINIEKRKNLIRYAYFIIGILLVAISYNAFVLPSNIVYGVGGIGVILKRLYNIDPSVTILIGSIILLILSLFLLGKSKTMNSVIGSFLYPIFVKLTESVSVINLAEVDLIVIVIFGAVLTGFGMGLVFKAGFTTGGTDILNQIVTDGIIVMIGAFAFGIEAVLYSIISLYVLSLLTDKVVLGISDSKAFYIITEHEQAIKKYLIYNLEHNVTVLEGSGGFTGNRQKVIMCIIPTKEYFKVKNEIFKIDDKAFFVVTDAYEVSGGR